MNVCIFIGRFTKTPELTQVKTGDEGRTTNVVNFKLAVTRKFKKHGGESSKQVVYLDFEAWDTGAEVIAKHFAKGDPIIVYTSARNNTFETAEGIRVSKIVFRVEKFDFPSNNGLSSKQLMEPDTLDEQ